MRRVREGKSLQHRSIFIRRGTFDGVDIDSWAGPGVRSPGALRPSASYSSPGSLSTGRQLIDSFGAADRVLLTRLLFSSFGVSLNPKFQSRRHIHSSTTCLGTKISRSRKVPLPLAFQSLGSIVRIPVNIYTKPRSLPFRLTCTFYRL